MACTKQILLAEEVKKVHLWLRCRTQEVGASQAWKEHLERKEVLEKYAQDMKTLAEDFWAINNQGDRRALCRIQWIRKVIKEYFSHGGREKAMQKERSRLKLDTLSSVDDDKNGNQTDKLKLLDVGSCYNPFRIFRDIDTYAIDLFPATDDVKKGNFLENEICTDYCDAWFTSPVVQLPCSFFDVVVFCLFLEYLPSPEQRWLACEKAWHVLKLGGILTIVTPDSNHPTANSQLMKTWKLALAKIGFIRFKIEKLKYLYCMAFRKTSYAEKYKFLPEYKLENDPKILIPQDFVNYESKLNTIHIRTHNEKELSDNFRFLPGDCT